MSFPVNNRTALCQALIDQYRDIAELVILLGDTENIYYLPDKYPDESSVQTAIDRQSAPSVMLICQSSSPDGQGRWVNELDLYIKTNDISLADQIANLLIRGVPDGEGLSIDLLQIHPAFEPMADGWRYDRRPDSNGVDQYVVSMSFTENR